MFLIGFEVAYYITLLFLRAFPYCSGITMHTIKTLEFFTTELKQDFPNAVSAWGDCPPNEGVKLIINTQSNDSQSNDTWLIHKLSKQA